MTAVSFQTSDGGYSKDAPGHPSYNRAVDALRGWDAAWLTSDDDVETPDD